VHARVLDYVAVCHEQHFPFSFNMPALLPALCIQRAAAPSACCDLRWTCSSRLQLGITTQQRARIPTRCTQGKSQGACQRNKYLGTEN